MLVGMSLSQVGYPQIHRKTIRFGRKKRYVWEAYHVLTSLGPHLATVGDVDVDGKVRIDQAHLVLELLGHALSSSVTAAGQPCTGMVNGPWVLFFASNNGQ